MLVIKLVNNVGYKVGQYNVNNVGYKVGQYVGYMLVIKLVGYKVG